MGKHTVTITPDEMTDTPVSPLLYGNFIELGYGIQVEPMWGELFINPSFEPFVPYKAINKHWFDLFHDERNESAGYESDWSRFDWYHSGYEHNPWFAAPGSEGTLEIADASTFLIKRSPTHDIAISLECDGAFHGETCLRIANRETVYGGGVAQSGKVLRRGETYRFAGYLKAPLGDVAGAEIRFYPVDNWSDPIAILPLSGPIGAEWTEFTVSWENKAFEGRAVFCLWLPPGSTVLADCFSLMPSSTIHGWRKEVIDAARRVNPTVLRWPGGCFASFYDWRDGIGPREQRKPLPSYFWGGRNDNLVGTAELATLARLLGAESMICVNLFHPRKEIYDHYFDEQRNAPMGFEFPQFVDLAEGARLAADWVAYCNAPADRHPMGALRAEHGYPEPFAVRFWEIDNEAIRWFSAEEYARAVVVYSRAMKAVDPTIQIGLISYDESYTAALESMLEIAGRDIDFLADRRIGEAATDGILQRMRDFNRAHGTALVYCNTEWLPYDFEPDAFNFIGRDGGATKSYLFSKWRYAMNALRTHLMWQRKGGDVLFVNFNNFANTHSQCVIDTPKEGAYLTAAGRAMELISRSPAAWPLHMEGYTPDDRAEFQLQAAWDRDRKALVLYVFNLTSDEQCAHFDLRRLEREFDRAWIARLSAESPVSQNTMSDPEAIRREDTVISGKPVAGNYAVVAPPFSFTEIVLTVEANNE